VAVLLPFFIVVIGIAVPAAVIGFALMSRGRWKEALIEVSDALKLQYDPGSLMKSARVYGMRGAFHVKVDSYTVSSGQSSRNKAKQ
jgi:hypothetical protein